MRRDPDDAPAPRGEGALAPGERVGRFVIARLIGAGGMGAVYEALDPELDRQVAIKVLRSEADALGGLRLVREAQALAQLSHPNVVAVHDVGVSDGRIYLAMERIDGDTLDVHLHRRAPGPRRIVDLFVQAGRGLAAAHARQIVHRDFKPGNVLVGRDGRVRVTDFGLARQAGADGDLPERDAAVDADDAALDGAATTIAASSATSSAGAPAPASATDVGSAETLPTPGGATPPRQALIGTPLTADGARVGTPRYMAPEQRAAIGATARSDQYAFCVALWEALTGAHPDDRDATPRRRLPRWLARALGRGLAKDPADRHPSMNALIEVLVRTPVRRRRAVIAAAALVAGGAAVGVGLALAPSHRIDCDLAGAAADDVWNAGVRARMTAAFTRARPDGATIARDVAGTLDTWTDAWRAARAEACRATHDRGEQSDAMLDRIAACLDGELVDARALIARLGAADATATRHARGAVGALPKVSRCDASVVGARPPPNLRAREAHRWLADAKAAEALGDLTAVERDAAAAAAAAGDAAPAVRARSLAIEGTMVADRDDARSRALLEEAMADAARSGDRDATLFVASQYLIRVTEEGVEARIEAVLPVLHAAAKAAPATSPYQVDAAEAEAVALLTLGRYDESEAACERLEPLEKGPPVRAAECRCNVVQQRGTGDPAACRRYVELATRVYGPDHLETGIALLDAAPALEASGHADEAIAARRRAIEIVEANGEHGEEAAYAHYGLGQSLFDAHRYAEARVELERALAIEQSVTHGTSERILTGHIAAGRAAARAGDRAAGRDHAAHAMADMPRVYGADSAAQVPTLVDLGSLQLDLGDREAALASFRRAVAVGDRKLPPGDPTVGRALVDEAEALVQLRRPAEAAASAERAIGILEPAKGDPEVIASAHLTLARALLATGQRARGRREAAVARDRFTALGALGKGGAAEAARLLGGR